MRPAINYLEVAPGVDPTAAAKQLESVFLDHGVQADSIDKLLGDVMDQSRTFQRLVLGFLGLGLVVGVAALGVISARAVVERRQHIGVLRAIGFRRGMVQASFVLEASFLALTSIALGSALGLAVAFNVISDAARSASWSGVRFDVPWTTLVVIFVAVYVVAVADDVYSRPPRLSCLPGGGTPVPVETAIDLRPRDALGRTRETEAARPGA